MKTRSMRCHHGWEANMPCRTRSARGHKYSATWKFVASEERQCFLCPRVETRNEFPEHAILLNDLNKDVPLFSFGVRRPHLLYAPETLLHACDSNAARSSADRKADDIA